MPSVTRINSYIWNYTRTQFVYRNIRIYDYILIRTQYILASAFFSAIPCFTNPRCISLPHSIWWCGENCQGAWCTLRTTTSSTKTWTLERETLHNTRRTSTAKYLYIPGIAPCTKKIFFRSHKAASPPWSQRQLPKKTKIWNPCGLVA